jgi:hypothetical protein
MRKRKGLEIIPMFVFFLPMPLIEAEGAYRQSQRERSEVAVQDDGK